jgi:CTP synthase
MEILEVSGHPFFFAVQFHPEFLSAPLRPSPVFVHFVRAALARKKLERGSDE